MIERTTDAIYVAILLHEVNGIVFPHGVSAKIERHPERPLHPFQVFPHGLTGAGLVRVTSRKRPGAIPCPALDIINEPVRKADLSSLPCFLFRDPKATGKLLLPERENVPHS